MTRCDYVTRRAGTDGHGHSIPTGGYGDRTETCGEPGREVPHTYWAKRPGTTSVYDPYESVAVRCPEHEGLS